MIDYKEYEKTVFEWLKEKHEKDRSFTFSLRKKGSKGAELDYFIGTETSNYFGTTFWYIPCGFPGSTADAIDVFFAYAKDKKLTYRFEIVQTKNPEDEQNTLVLAFVKNLKSILRKEFPTYQEPPLTNKMELCKVLGKDSGGYENIQDLFADLEDDLNKMIPIIDKALADFKAQNPTFIGDRITEEEFKESLEKMDIRIKKYTPSTEPEEIELEDDTNENETPKEINNKPPLNQILFGPPGTGKTYNSINKALKIINEAEEQTLIWQDREAVKAQFDKRLAEGRIVFTTFHQSMNYEDFIEGIKPLEPKVEGQAVNYKVIDGIFKEIAKNASSVNTLAASPEKGNLNLEPELLNKINYYKASLGNSAISEDTDIYEYCMKNNVIAIGLGEEIDFGKATSEKELIDIFKQNNYKTSDYAVTALKCLMFWMKKNDIVFISNGNKRVRAIGQIVGDYYFNNDSGIRYCQFRPVRWLAKNLDIPVEMIYEKKFSQQAIYQMEKLQIKKDFFIQQTQEEQSDKTKNYVLIIDEINRGNVSQIFGELITLIEEDKRLGQAEALEIMLPYSKEKFGVPANLYIIGTMNTADRSVEALDTALRRRFSFEEMPPKPELIASGGKLKEHKGTLEGIDLGNLLSVINKRIEKLLDKDHQIGHSYFMSVYTLETLNMVFQNKIIPLLQEYFFGDYGKIGLVLGKGFVKKKIWNNKEIAFADFEYESVADFEEKEVYEIIDYTNEAPDYTLQIKNVDIRMNFDKAIKLLLNQAIEQE